MLSLAQVLRGSFFFFSFTCFYSFVILSVLICTRHPCHLNVNILCLFQSKEEVFFFFFFLLLVLKPLSPRTSRTVLSPPELRLTQSHRKQNESRQSNRGIIKTSPSSLSTFQRYPSLWQGVVLIETNLVCIVIIRAKEFQSTCFCERGPLYKVFLLAGFV